MTTPEPPAVQLLFPMGGLGTRFAREGYAVPKPLVPVDGTPMILKALASFAKLTRPECGVRVKHIFVVRADHEERDRLRTRLAEAVPGAAFATLAGDTRGAVESCLAAEGLIDPRLPLVVMDCDLWFDSAAYTEVLTRMACDAAAGAGEAVSGLLLYFNSTAPRYSFAAPADDAAAGAATAAQEEAADASTVVREVVQGGPGRFVVARTAEKDPISDCALIGAYGFGSGRTFLAAAHRLVATLDLGAPAGPKEFYVSLLFNHVIAAGGTVVAVPRDAYHSFGTPEELRAYEAGRERSYVDE